MLVPVMISLHVLAAIIWVGGMFFAYIVLRPVAGKLLEAPTRLSLWSNVFARFFPWVWAAIIILPVSGYIMIFQTWGGFENIGWDLKLMHILGWVMILIFLHVFFAPFHRLAHAVEEGNYERAGKQLNMIRRIIAVNLSIGIIVVIIAAGGRYYL